MTSVDQVNFIASSFPKRVSAFAQINPMSAHAARDRTEAAEADAASAIGPLHSVNSQLSMGMQNAAGKKHSRVEL